MNESTTKNDTNPDIASKIAEDMKNMNPQDLMGKLLMMKMMQDMMSGGMGGNQHETAARVQLNKDLLRSQMTILDSIITKSGYKVTIEDRRKLTGIMRMLVGIIREEKDGISNKPMRLKELDEISKKKKK